MRNCLIIKQNLTINFADGFVFLCVPRYAICECLCRSTGRGSVHVHVVAWTEALTTNTSTIINKFQSHKFYVA